MNTIPAPIANEVFALTVFSGADGSGTATQAVNLTAGIGSITYAPADTLTNGDTVVATVKAANGYQFTGGLSQVDVDITVAGLA